MCVWWLDDLRWSTCVVHVYSAWPCSRTSLAVNGLRPVCLRALSSCDNLVNDLFPPWPYRRDSLLSGNVCQAGLSKVDCRPLVRLRRPCRAVDIVAKIEHVQLGRLCRKWVIFVARMSNVLSTVASVACDRRRILTSARRNVYAGYNGAKFTARRKKWEWSENLGQGAARGLWGSTAAWRSSFIQMSSHVSNVYIYSLVFDPSPSDHWRGLKLRLSTVPSCKHKLKSRWFHSSNALSRRESYEISMRHLYVAEV